MNATPSSTPGPSNPAGEARTSAGPPGLSPTASLLVLVGVFLAILMGAMDGLVVSTVLPTIANDLHQKNGVPFVVSGYLIASTLAIPIFARLSDITGRRNVFLAGLAIFIVGSALAGVSQDLGELIAFRSMQGFGGGAVFPVAVATVAVLYPPESRAKVIGALTGAAGVAIVAGPLLGSYIVSVTTWRWVFYINLPFGLFGLLIIWAAVGPLRPESRGSFDVLGAALLSAWVAALMFPLVQVSGTAGHGPARRPSPSSAAPSSSSSPFWSGNCDTPNRSFPSDCSANGWSVLRVRSCCSSGWCSAVR